MSELMPVAQAFPQQSFGGHRGRINMYPPVEVATPIAGPLGKSPKAPKQPVNETLSTTSTSIP